MQIGGVRILVVSDANQSLNRIIVLEGQSIDLDICRDLIPVDMPSVGLLELLEICAAFDLEYDRLLEITGLGEPPL